MTVDPNKSAFPLFNADRDIYVSQLGLTKREYFAAIAMQGLLASDNIPGETRWTADGVASLAIEQADGLIAALNGEGQTNG